MNHFKGISPLGQHDEVNLKAPNKPLLLSILPYEKDADNISDII